MERPTSRFVGLYAIGAAGSSLILAPLLALAYLATAQGAADREIATVAAWARPAREAAGVLVTFASPDRVYAVYTLLFALLMPALFVTAATARTSRPRAARRLERLGWKVALTGYAVLAAGLLVVAALLLPGDPAVRLLDPVFLTVIIPGLLIAMIGSTMLSIALLRSGYRPRTTAWLLAASFPLWIVGSSVLGHNSIGLVPLLIAWAATAWSWRAGVVGEDIVDAAGNGTASRRASRVSSRP